MLRTQHVAGVENISGQDLRDGRLKAILALFFALSRHKQATKQQKVHQQQQQQQLQQQHQLQQHLQQNQVEMTPNRYVTSNTRTCIIGCEHSKLGCAFELKALLVNRTLKHISGLFII